MKYLPLLLVFLTACRSIPPAPVTLVRPDSPPGTRIPEVVQVYHSGRYVDPQNILHDPHPLYRIEASPRWNLRGGSLTQAMVATPPTGSAPLHTNDVILAELSRQKDATERVMWEAFQLARSYEEVQKLMAEMIDLARKNAGLQTRIGNTERRVFELEKQLPQR